MPNEKASDNLTFSEWLAKGYDQVMNPRQLPDDRVTVGEALCLITVEDGKAIQEDLAKFIVSSHRVSPESLKTSIANWNHFVVQKPDTALFLKEIFRVLTR